MEKIWFPLLNFYQFLPISPKVPPVVNPSIVPILWLFEVAVFTDRCMNTKGNPNTSILFKSGKKVAICVGIGHFFGWQVM